MAAATRETRDRLSSRITAAGKSTGTLLAIEGIDGAGKRTQANLLNRALEARGISCINFSFPRYESFFGQLVGRFLNGDFGPLDAVDPHFSALLYAGNRLEATPDLQAALAAGQTILADRYIASNLAHQTARMPGRAAARIPEVVAPTRIQRLRIARGRLGNFPAPRAHRSPVNGWPQSRRDSHLHRTQARHPGVRPHSPGKAARVYDRLATEPNWVTIECAITSRSNT